MYSRPLKAISALASPMAPVGTIAPIAPVSPLPPVPPVARNAFPLRPDAQGLDSAFAAAPRAAAPGTAGVYSQVAQDSAVISASAPQLITLLFDGARQSIAMARHHMARGEVAAKGRAVSRAVGIVGHGLKASLDPKAGGDAGAALVAQLEPLYDYICQRLVLANLRNDPQLLDEAERLLEAVASAWRAVTRTGDRTGDRSGDMAGGQRP